MNTPEIQTEKPKRAFAMVKDVLLGAALGGAINFGVVLAMNTLSNSGDSSQRLQAAFSDNINSNLAMATFGGATAYITHKLENRIHDQQDQIKQLKKQLDWQSRTETAQETGKGR